MKVPLNSAILSTALSAVVICIAMRGTNTVAETIPLHRESLPNVDTRAHVELAAPVIASRNVAKARLQTLVSGSEVNFDSIFETPKFVRAKVGFLTGANGEGVGVTSQTASAFAANDPYRAVKGFLNEHTDLFGHGAEILQGAIISRESVTAHNGLKTVVWQQTLDGIPVFEGVLIGNITKDGELVSIASQLLPNLSAIADAGTPNRVSLQSAPVIVASQAIVIAAQNVGDNFSAGDVATQGYVGGTGFQEFTVGSKSAQARQSWLPANRGEMRLCWEVIVRKQSSPELYQLLIDAETGVVRIRRSLTHDISNATYNVYTSDSPSPFSPGHPNPSTVQPPLVNRTLVTTSALDLVASPNGWINDGDNETQGNNADTFTDRNFDQQPDGPRPQGNPNRVFDFTLDLNQAPLTYSNASTVQLFYLINWYHDRLYQFGFTESAGNFQNNNFGRGGAGNDRVLGYVQAGADVGFSDNAFFSTPPDGLNGEMAMFVWSGTNPDRDGSLDAEIVFHEASHGLSWRLVGGGQGLGTIQSDGMGEGWSDFYALSLLSDAADDPNAVYAAAAYASFRLGGLNENYYFGIRHFPYSTDLGKNPFTFKDIDRGQISPHTGVPRSPIYPFNASEADEVHHQGEIWCVTLWEVRANLIRKYGPSANQLMLQLVTDGMKLTPASPNFLQARDAILLADQVNNGGANYLDIWRGFAKRGMGYSATSPASTTTSGVVEAFDLPGLQVAVAGVAGGNGNGVIDYNECNDLLVAISNITPTGITNVQVTVSTRTLGVTLVNKISPYPNIPSGGSGTNFLPFTISTAPFFVCGTPIELAVQIKSDEITAVNNLVLSSGRAGAAIRFDNSTPAFIRDNDLVGTNSLITVSNITSAINKVTLSMFLTHTFVSDLAIDLIGPDGQTVKIFDHTGAGGDNFGASCAPDIFRTIFDDASLAPITGAVAPYVGTFKPQQPLSAFIGKNGTNVNGIWKLRIVDSVRADVGYLQCWSLNITAAACVDGGGTCPGAELALGLTDAPDPTYIGSNLVYTISVTNNGPSEAKNVIVNQTLAPSVVFYSGTSSVGNVTHAGNAVIANIGILPINGIATVTITVLPTLTGLISSTATVSANDVDIDLSNNSRTVTTQVNPPASDIAVGISDLPDPALVGGTLTYTVNVTNNGPSTASGVFVTNTLPLTVGIQSATATLGTVTILGNKVVHNVGVLTNTGRATATIVVTPLVTGTIVATSAGKANQADPFPGNNSATASTVVGPSSDISLTMSDSPDPAVVNSNWVYTITVTNNGPSAASGVIVNQTLPANVTIVGATTTSGTVATGAGSVTATIGSLANGAGAVISVTAKSSVVGTYSSTATATASQTDSNPANNSASASTTVSLPFVSIIPAGATLTAESVAPADGGLSVGETVTVQLRLRNAGNITSGTVTATLLATNGVTAPSGTLLSYGPLTASGAVGSQAFGFTASGTNGGTVIATLQIFTNGVFHGNALFTFTLPTVRTFANTNSITINDLAPATPYPSTIAVAGVTGLVGKVTVTISNLSHTYPDDIDMLLVSPTGQKVILMSDAGGQPNNAAGVSSINVTFDDAAALIPDEGPLLSGSYHPSNYLPSDTFNSPAPSGPYGANLSDYIGANANGTWSLYIVDDSPGDVGSISKGWSIAFTTLTPVNQVADIGLIATASPASVLVGDNLTNTFTISNAGPNAAANITFTNVVPASATIVSATSSLGSAAINGNTVTANLPSLNSGASASVTVIMVPGLTAIPTLTCAANIATTDTDLNPANNTASAVATVSLPAANLGITQTLSTNIIALSNNVVITLDITNAGPNTALNVLVTDALPAGVSFVSSTALNATNSSGTVTVGLGNLASGSLASFSITGATTSGGIKTNTASVATTSSDSVPSNNSATQTFTVVTPSPSIVAAGALITSESGTVNGAVDLGETVTVALTLQNVGTANTTNLRATLQSNSSSQSYGALAQAGGSQSRNFTFTAPAVNNGPFVATLALQDERVGVTNNLGTVSFVFDLPSSASFTNSTVINIPDSGGASPYPSSITVSGMTGVVASASVRLNNLTHGFPDDLDIMLVSPMGQKMLLMSDSGGGHSVSGITLTFINGAASLPDSLQLTTGTFKPTNYELGLDTFSAPAPSGTPGSDFTVFNGTNPNGDWALYVMDDSIGDLGNIGGGWSLTLNTISVVNPLADVSVTMSAATDFGAPNPPFVGSAVTYSIGVTNNGPATATAVAVSDTLPAGLTFVTSGQSQGSSSFAAGLVTFNVGSLASGAGAGLTVRVVPSTGGLIANTANVTAAETDLNTANNSALVATTVRVPVTPALSAVSVTNSQTKFTLTGDAGMNYRILGSTNLTTWTVLGTSTAAPNGTIKFTDTGSTNFSSRYYRAERVIP